MQRAPLWAKSECLSAEHNNLIEVLHCPELLVPSGETKGRVVQRHRPVMMTLWAKVEGFLVKDNGLIEARDCPESIAPRGEMNSKVDQIYLPIGVPFRVKVQSFSAEDNGLPCCRDALQGKPMRHFAWGGQVAEALVLHDQIRSLGRRDWFGPLSRTWRREIQRVSATLQLVDTSFHCYARRENETNTFRVHDGSPNLMQHGDVVKRWYVV